MQNVKQSNMLKSKIQETLDTIGKIDFDIRWVQQKIAKQNYNSFKKSIEHQEKIQMMDETHSEKFDPTELEEAIEN